MNENSLETLFTILLALKVGSQKPRDLLTQVIQANVVPEVHNALLRLLFC